LNGKTKKQHYVPQFLLRKFSVGRKSKAKIWVYDKSKGKRFRASVRDIGHENSFYEATASDGRAIEAESLSEHIDDRGSKAIELVLKRGALPIQSREMVDLSYFVAFQMLRTPDVRGGMDYLRQQIIEKWGPDIRAEGDDRPVGDYTYEDSRFSSIMSLQDTPEFAKILQGKIHFLTECPPGKSFLISDTPVVKHNYLDYGHRGSLGIGQKGIHVFLPLSSKYCLEYVCPEMADRLTETEYGQCMLMKQNLGLPWQCMPENVEFVNSLQVIQSERWVYSQENEDLDLVEEMINEHQDLSIPASNKTIRK
jgi:hypothetical protein